MRSVRQLCIAILTITAIAALYVGYMLINDSDGRSMSLSLDDLKGTPFTDYSTPGWLWLVVIGIGSAIAAIVTIQHHKIYPYLIIAEGLLLFVFVALQMMLQQGIHFGQIVFGLFAVALVLLGNLIRKYLKQKVQLVPKAVAAEHHGKKSHYHKNRKRGH